MTKAKPVVLFVGICLGAICALFPPRRINNTSSFQFVERQDGKLAPYDVPHAFLFSPNFGIYRASGSVVFPAEVDAGRLLAELVLIGALIGMTMLAPHLQQIERNERSREP